MIPFFDHEAAQCEGRDAKGTLTETYKKKSVEYLYTYINVNINISINDKCMEFEENISAQNRRIAQHTAEQQVELTV